MTPDRFIFRRLAHESLARAKVELGANTPDRLRYAALELRDAMEALTYQRALAFEDDISPEEYKTWQPRKLMSLLVDIDPLIDISSTISVRKESGELAPPENMKTIGTDHVFTLANLKAHYDAIGSYLHMPSLEQVRSGKMPDPARLRERCEIVVAEVERSLSSGISNVRIGYLTTLNQCMNEHCKKPIRKKMPVEKETIDVQCFECKAEYTVTAMPGGNAIWKPKSWDVPCATSGCPEKRQLWRHELQLGANWWCRACGVHNIIVLSVRDINATCGQIHQ
jgi:hypothetical protein